MIVIRLFLALNFPGDVTGKIGEIIGTVRANSLSGRFVERENIHLTLEFLGEVEKERLNIINTVMDGICGGPFSLRLARAGLFKRPEGDIWWIGIERSDALLSLQKALNKALSDAGFTLEDRKYTPHITIGRKVKPKEGFNPDALSALIRGLKIDIDRIDLMKSDFVNGRTFYSVLYSKKL